MNRVLNRTGWFLRVVIGRSLMIIAATVSAPFIFGGAYLEEKFRG